MPEFTVSPLTASIGAEISGIDLAAPIDVATRERLSHALAEHLALVFHDQKLTPEQYLAAAEAFGPPMRQHYSQHQMPEYPDIGLVWHRNGQQPAATNRGAQCLEVGCIDREQAAEHHRLRGPESRQRRRGRLAVVGDGIAHARVSDFLD